MPHIYSLLEKGRQDTVSMLLNYHSFCCLDNAVSRIIFKIEEEIVYQQANES